MTHKTVIRPSVETVSAIHTVLIDQIGGLDGIRDEKLLDMSVNSPFQTFGGIDLYPTPIHKAAHLVFSLIKNHPFIDGNKRIGVTAMIVFLKSNGLDIKCTNEELAEFGISLADGSHGEDYARDWIKSHIC